MEIPLMFYDRLVFLIMEIANGNVQARDITDLDV